MTKHDLEKLDKFPHLADYSTRDLILNLGLYEPLMIDTASVQYITDGIREDEVPHVVVSRDVHALHDFVKDTSRVVLPCSECKDDRPFDQRPGAFTKSAPEFGSAIGVANLKKTSTVHFNVFDQPKCSYIFGIDTLAGEIQINDDTEWEIIKTECAHAVICGLIGTHDLIHKEFRCTLEPALHKLYADFVIVKAVNGRPDELLEWDERNSKYQAFPTGDVPVMTEEEKKVDSLYDKLWQSLLFIKIGQYPSMADMQLFDSKKYRNILGKNYRDYTTALGLYASGIGSGSFLYLRRVFEKLVEEIHQECKKESSWNEDTEDKYISAHFDQRIKILEKSGKTIIPDELNQVKNQLYNALSIGVHEAPDDECKELFPFMKFAIDCILDKKIQERERNRKIKELTKATTEFTNKHNC